MNKYSVVQRSGINGLDDINPASVVQFSVLRKKTCGSKEGNYWPVLNIESGSWDEVFLNIHQHQLSCEHQGYELPPCVILCHLDQTRHWALMLDFDVNGVKISQLANIPYLVSHWYSRWDTSSVQKWLFTIIKYHQNEDHEIVWFLDVNRQQKSSSFSCQYHFIAGFSCPWDPRHESPSSRCLLAHQLPPRTLHCPLGANIHLAVAFDFPRPGIWHAQLCLIRWYLLSGRNCLACLRIIEHRWWSHALFLEISLVLGTWGG